MQKVKYLILGAGISGLTFATLKRQEDYLIIEKGNKAGGLCKSFYENGYVWDVAGHFFHFHSAETKKYYIELMNGVEQKNVKKCAKVYYSEKMMDAPFQFNIHQLKTKEFIECLTDLYFAHSGDSAENFEDYVKCKYGNGIANKFLIPYNEKLYACKMNELEKNSMGAFLPKLDFCSLMNYYRMDNNLSGKTYNDFFMYPVNGCMEVINSLMKKLDKEKIKLSEKVIEIDTDKKEVVTDREIYNYEYLISSVPLSTFIECEKGKKENILNWNKVLVLNIGFDRPSIDKNVSWIYFPGGEIFYRVGFYNNIAGTQKLSVYVEIGYSKEEEIDIEYAFKQTINDLKKVGIIGDHNVDSWQPYIIDPGYVHITTECTSMINDYMSKMKEKNVYMIGRYARWEYSAMDDSFEQAFKLNKEI